MPALYVLSNTAVREIGEILKHVGHVSVIWLPEALQRCAESEATCESGRVRVVDHSALLSQCIGPVTKVWFGSPEISDTVAALVNLASNIGTIGYYLPQLLRGIDREGLVLPQEVARSL
jgi:hypothetical protein